MNGGREQQATWRERRSAFNHDWLQNRLVQILGSGIGFLRREFEEAGFTESFAERLRSQWNLHRGQVADLVETFEVEMTPRLLLNRSPLDRLDGDTRSWLGQVVHESWLARRHVRELLEEVRVAEREAEAAFLAVEEQLLHLIPARTAVDLEPLLPALQTLERRARALSAAISRMPDQIEVT